MAKLCLQEASWLILYMGICGTRRSTDGRGEAVWYVIQTYSGNEAEVSNFIRASLEPKMYKKCFVPIYEEVRHRKGKSRILFRKLFPGYVFIDLDETGAEKAHHVLRKFPEFARILSTVSRDGKKVFKAIEPDEQEFLESLLEDGVLRVSYIETEKNKKKIKRIIGPLGKYRNNITSFSTSSREAIVEIDMLGVHHRIRFGLWNEEDAKLPVFEELMGKPEETVLYGTGEIDVGIYPGDIVIGKEEPFEGITFIVEKVNLLQRTIDTKMELFGSLRDMTVYIDQVEKPERQNIDPLVL